MKLANYFRISAPAAERVPSTEVDGAYRRCRNRTFWGVTAAYSLYYVCRTVLSVVKQPLIDDGILTAAQLGMISSAFMFVYAVGKFSNGFIADYCNVRRFMAAGLLISALVNFIMGAAGLLHGMPGFTSMLLFILFAVLWGVNGWVQSMGAPPGVISLSRWFPLKERGTWYSIFSSTPYLGKSLTMVIVGALIGVAGRQWGFLFASFCGLAGTAIILLFVSDTPESKGLPSIQELSGEEPVKTDGDSTHVLHKQVLKHPAIWVIALSSAFIYITQYAVSNWGVLFLQKTKGFSGPGNVCANVCATGSAEVAVSTTVFLSVYSIIGRVYHATSADVAYCWMNINRHQNGSSSSSTWTKPLRWSMRCCWYCGCAGAFWYWLVG